MSPRRPTLEERRQGLLRHSSAQRAALRGDLGDAVAPLQVVDQGLVRLGHLLRHPLVAGTGVLLLVVLGRRGALRRLGAGLALAGPALRLARLLGPAAAQDRR